MGGDGMKDYRVMEVGHSAVDRLIRKHYLHSWPGVVTAVLALMEGSKPIGALVFAMPPRETMIRYGVQSWELARLFIEDVTPKNTETWFVSRAIQWVRSTHPKVGMLISYADPSAGHKGTIYRAGNWIFDGMTDQERKSARCDYVAEVSDTQDSLFEGPSLQPRLVKFSRKGHVPEGVSVSRRPRSSKFRFVYWLDGCHEKRRQASVSARAEATA